MMATPLPTDPSFVYAVRPYLAQLTSLPQALLHANADGLSWDVLLDLYLSTNPFISGLFFSLALAPIFLIASEIEGKHSQVDRVWSIVPGVYHAHFWLWASLHGLWTTRLSLVLLCSVVWGIRLTHNFWRKGGYRWGDEDYRWTVVKSKFPNKFAFFIFNVTFVSTWQSVVLFLFTAPSYILLLSSAPGASGSQPTLQTADIAFTIALLVLVLLQGIADQQQWNYQQAKKGNQSGTFSSADLKRGFCTHGLWKYSRHPNVAAEQAFWFGLYLWSTCYAGPINWSLAGTIVYLLPFNDSTKLTEGLSAAKYPQYSIYQQQVGRFWPRISILWGKGMWQGVGNDSKTK